MSKEWRKDITAWNPFQATADRHGFWVNIRGIRYEVFPVGNRGHFILKVISLKTGSEKFVNEKGADSNEPFTFRDVDAAVVAAGKHYVKVFHSKSLQSRYGAGEPRPLSGRIRIKKKY